MKLADSSQADLVGLLRATPGLTMALLHTPTAAHDPYLDDGPPPQLMLECGFPTIEALEAAIGPGGALASLATSALFPGDTSVTQQAMIARRFPIQGMPAEHAGASPLCSYMVAYEGPADDLNLWLSHYIAHHPPIMARFPGIRQVEVFTRIDWCSALPWPRVEYMQRNKVVFDSAEALNAALASPIRAEMRADFHHFPPFRGKITHYPMTTLTVVAQEVAPA
jgi:uncharacterized protein (TIGR02118 family)